MAVKCKYCEREFDNFSKYSDHIVSIATGSRTLETCLEVYADFLSRNIRSEWKGLYSSMFPPSNKKLFVR